MFRQIPLPQRTPGKLYIHSMPGRIEQMNQFITEINNKCIDLVICLASEAEVRSKSPDYYSLRASKRHTFPLQDFPIKDYSVPQAGEKENFKAFIQEICERLLRGESLLIHCKMGIGRTGTVVVCILLNLGLSLEAAITTARNAESYPMVQEQDDFVAWYASSLLP